MEKQTFVRKLSNSLQKDAASYAEGNKKRKLFLGNQPVPKELKK